MPLLKNLKVIVFIHIFLIIIQFANAESVKYDFDSKLDSQYYSGWAVTSQKIDRVPDDELGGYVLRFTGSGWNTAMFDFVPPFKVTNTTLLRFRIKVSRPGGWKILLRNATEEAEYGLHFSVKKANEWVTVQLPISNAAYRRFGKKGVKIDGLVGDKISKVQIAYLGKEMQLDDIELIDLTAKAFKQLKTNDPAVEEYLKSYIKKDYPKLARNGFFPFGVILTQRGEAENADIFKQPKLERYEDDLLAIKKAGFNSLADFCTQFDLATHMKLMSFYNLKILCTRTSSRNIFSLSDEKLAYIKEFSHHPNLIGWYGQDEPTNFKLYLKNKRRVETLSDGGAPYASAMHMTSAIPLAPCMDVVIVDPYSLMGPFDPVKSSSILERHRIHIDNTRKISKGRRVWVIAQAFSRRDKNNRLQRFPRPVEVRFDVLNYLASGGSGFMFFIANDTVPYLDNKFRAQEFDKTLFDAWGNENATTKELGLLAKRLIPIMPSFLDIESSEKLKIVNDNSKIIIRQWENELGNLVFCVNSDLSEKISSKIKIDLSESASIYNLETLKFVGDRVIDLNLEPGDGRLLLIANSQQFSKAKLEINFRKLVSRWESLDLNLKILKKAGFETSNLNNILLSSKPVKEKFDIKALNISLEKLAGQIESLRASNPEYCDFHKKLSVIQSAFGRINSALTDTGVIEKVDNNPKWMLFFKDIRVFSCVYFQLYRNWSNGKLDGLKSKLSSLEISVNKLEKKVMSKLQADGIEAYPGW